MDKHQKVTLSLTNLAKIINIAKNFNNITNALPAEIEKIFLHCIFYNYIKKVTNFNPDIDFGQLLNELHQEACADLMSQVTEEYQNLLKNSLSEDN